MARAELEELYRILVDTRFEFVARGEAHLREIYAIVRKRFPQLCDDTYLCSTNCKSGYDSPEWKHVVGTSLNELKKRRESVSSGSARGMWHFGPSGVTMPDLNEAEVIEGRSLLRLHKLKERKSQIVRSKKRAVLAATGRLQCEACNFNFAAALLVSATSASLGHRGWGLHHAELDGYGGGKARKRRSTSRSRSKESRSTPECVEPAVQFTRGLDH